MTKFKVTCSEQNAPKFLDWIKTQGGVAYWKSVNLSNIGLSWSTPALAPDKTSYPKPNWQAHSTPSFVVTDPSEIGVSIDKEVKRFHVAIRRGAQGMSFKCTQASSAKIDKAVEKAGEGAFYTFDYETQDAVIFAPEGKPKSLKDWEAEHESNSKGK
jgi:hypothetical protein